MIATIAVIADKNGSAIASIDGFHMIAAIAEWRPRGPGSNNIVRAIPQIQHSGCELSTPTWGVFSCNHCRRERQRTPVPEINRISLRLFSSCWFSCTCLYIPLKIWCTQSYFCTSSIKSAMTIAFSMFVLVAILKSLSVRNASRYLIWGRWDALCDRWRVAYDRCDRHDHWNRTEVYLSDRCRYNRCDRCHRWRVVSISSLRSLNFFSSIAAIVVIIWKSGLNVLKKLWKFVFKINKYIFKRNCSIVTMNWDHTAKKIQDH